MAKDGKLSRLARLGSLTGRMTGSYLSDKVKGLFADEDERKELRERTHRDNAVRMVETLGRLKGAAMKIGQQVAIAAQHLDLPDDVRATLSKLHAEAEPVPAARIREVVQAELEAPISELFADFEDAPLGTASLAQAHAATLPTGEAVVVKVLHDGVAESVETDLLALRALLASGRAMGRDKSEVDGVLREVKDRLREELDYLQEAANIHAFATAFAGDERVRVPSLHPSLCTERVLVMDRLMGVPLEDFASSASDETRQRAGLNLAELFFEMAFVKRLLHADPHPGNYLFEPDGRVGLLDFGCVKRFDPYWIGHYARTVLAALDGDREACLQAVRDLGAWVGDSPEAADAIWDFCQAVVAPWREGSYTIGGTNDSLLDRARPVAEALWRHREIHGPPDIIFLHRTLGGLYTLARRLKVTAEWGPMLRRYLGHAVGVMEGRVEDVGTRDAPPLPSGF